MKLVTFEANGATGAGYLDGDDIVVCADGPGAAGAILSLIDNGMDEVRAWAAMGAGGASRVPAKDAKLLAPIPEPRRNIFCVGKNYHAHANEFHSSGFDSSGKEAVPSAPIIFSKATTSVVGPDDVVKGSLDHTNSVDYEGELGVIIGTRAFQVPRDKAYEHVFGYVIINDVTSRELQRHHNQWLIGKSLDTFCPMGPYIVTADEAGDVSQMVLETQINGETRQKASVSDLIFDIPTIIETMTATMTLLPGDIIATGTCDGVGIGFNPPKYLKKNDRMSVRITGLGELNNTIG
jgi:2-keto-4-pentenoate hydratase/2-oxohepta-3-ene-1,7-dioic acid hydratase in catechol pathway